MHPEPSISDKSQIIVAVVGGGIGGLCIAIALGRAKYSVHLFEQAAAFSEIGAGIGLGPNSLDTLRLLDILPEYEAIADMSKPNPQFFEFVKWDDGKWIGETTSKGRNSTVHRARFLEALLPLLPSNVTTHFSSRIVRVENTFKDESPIVRLTIETSHTDQSNNDQPRAQRTFEAAAVIGTDGVKSTVRESMGIGGCIRYTGTYAYRGLLPMQDVMKKNGEGVKMWIGPEKHILVFPIESGCVLNLVAFVSDRSQDPDDRVWPGPWVKPCTVDELLSDFEGWDEDCRGLLKLIKKPERWALHELVPLERWTVNRITLLGDSAHASLPHNGAGAGQAIEDTYVLSSLLSQPECTAVTLPSFLQAYEEVRRPRAARQQVHSRESGENYELSGPHKDNYDALAEELAHRYEWIWEHDLKKDVDEALKWLQQRGVLERSRLSES